MDAIIILGGLFAVSFIAATLLPAQSEAALAVLLLAGNHSPVVLVGVASIGNILGSLLNWYLGRQIETFRHKRWFPITEKALARAQGWYGRWGRWSLLASWMPFIGDPLTVVAGVMREPLWSFTLLVALAKTGRYIAVAVLATAM
jgi:membrane protein YqaA with SNARE-associated domain